MESESEQSRKPKYTRVQEAAFQKLWIWNYQQRFPIALYPLLQDLVAGLNDASIERLLHIAETYFEAQDTLQAAKQAKYPLGGYITEPNPYQEYRERFKELLEVHLNSEERQGR
jgi:hypothetical protein